MSMHFSANQFEREFKPQRLGNWQVPKWYPQRPRARKSPTRIIADDKGHLLAGIRRSDKSPWGNYIGTWDLPKRITREQATELSNPRAILTSWEKRSSHIPLTKDVERPKTGKKKEEKEITNIERFYRSGNGKSKSASHTKNKKDDEKNKNNRGQSARPSPPHSALSVTGHSATPTKLDGNISPPNQNTPPKSPGAPLHTSSRQTTPPKSAGPPLATAYCSSQVAKQHAQDNLKHQPLPDKIFDPTYRALESQRDPHPGLSLDVEPSATAVGWHGYGASGPTQCSKLQVYRPKTAGVIPKKSEQIKDDPEEQNRPGTSIPKKSKLQRQRNISNMHLAICWDLKPEEEEEEPKRPKHIDGSNGSVAPAVFTLVKQQDEEECCNSAGCGTPEQPAKISPDNRLSSISSGSAEKIRSRPKTAWGEKVNSRELQNKLESLKKTPSMDSNNNNEPAEKENSAPNIQHTGMENNIENCSSHHGSSNKSLNRRKWSAERTVSNESDSAASLKDKIHHRSSPNLNVASENDKPGPYVPGKIYNSSKQKRFLKKSRTCMACELKGKKHPIPGESIHPQEEYKMAFKAGKPSNSFDESIRPVTSNSRVKVRVPKIKAPFAKRTYSIDTLAPPFSLWPGNTGQDYPEHWRLASVYQHAYKPIEARKKPLIASVFQ